MQRRTFLRSGLAGVVSGPAVLSLVGPRGVALGAEPVRGFAEPVRLSSNENPLGIPDGSRRALIDRLTAANRYPQGREDVIAAVARHHHVAPENVVLGNGSTEVLQMVVQANAPPGARMVLPDPTFEHLEAYAQPFGYDVVKVPLLAEGAHDLQRMEEAVRGARGPVVVFICNPNNPTGTLTSCDGVEDWIHRAPETVQFVIDEAYFDYVETPAYRTLLPLIRERRNVLVNRTFSKIYGLAGLRLGYGLAHPDAIARVAALAANTNINQLVLAAAVPALEDHDFVRRSLEVNREGLRFAGQTLDELGVERLPSHTNFVMHRITGDLRTYIDRMREAGVLVGRPFPPMLEWNRVSIGTPEEMHTWADRLKSFRARNWI